MKARVWCALALALAQAGWAAKKAEPAPKGSGLSAETTAILELAAKSERLGKHLAAFDKVQKLAAEGDFRQAQAAAHQVTKAAAAEPVTQEEMPAREVVRAMAIGREAELLGLVGARNDAKTLLGTVERMKVPRDVMALARVGQGYVDLLDLDLRSAVDNERRAASMARGVVAPVIEAARGVWEGEPERALAVLTRLFDQGATGQQALLQAGCAALAAGRVADAVSYLGRCQTDRGYLPQWLVAAGLAAAASGDLKKARERFDQAAAREFGPLRRGKLLAGVAALASGDVEAGKAALAAARQRVPANYQRLAADLLAAASPTTAAEALAKPGWWWSLRGYQSGELKPAPAAAPSKTASAGDVPPLPVGGTGVAPLVGPAAPAGTFAPAPGGGSSTPQPAAGVPVGQARLDGQSPSSVEVRLATSQAVAAYEGALRLMMDQQWPQAELALRSAVRLWPALAEAWLGLGHVFLRRADYESARQAFDACVRLRPEWPESLYGLAYSLDKLGRADAAGPYYQAALKAGLTGPPATLAASRAR